ncbi:RNA binding motif protein 12Ba [Sebastes fasciatus]|uniref:RNA binding motif protein 12Ba n=1 Tax=Sebastes fasciatus TaxID=394691 RepID=UPI003D9F472C
MTIILRLQGLDVKAGTEDIRSFFEGIHIPDGGVYIVGGSLREAFIAFSSEREAQLAMRLTGNPLKGSNVALHISSMEELERKLKSLLKRRRTEEKEKPSPMLKRPHLSPQELVPHSNAFPNKRKKPSPTTQKRPQSSPDANVPPLTSYPNVHNPNSEKLPQPLSPDVANLQPLNASSLDANTAFLLGVCTVLQGLQSSLQSENNEAMQRVPEADRTVAFDEVRTPKQTAVSRPGYVRLFGLPATTTKQDICRFLKGLTVQEAIVNVELGRKNICLVKFASVQDACDALRFNKQYLGPISVEVRSATEKMWTSVLQECETTFDDGERVKRKRDPRLRTENHKEKNPYALQDKRQSLNRLPSILPKKPRPDGDSISTSSPTMEYIVMASNIPKNMTKTDIKELFGCPNIPHTNVLHLLNKEGSRTDTAFLIFNRTEDYDYAINLTGCHVGSDAIEVSSITKKMMWDMMAQTRHRSLERCPKTDAKKRPIQKWKSDPVEPPEEAPSTNPDPAARTCLFVSNMPADVQEGHIKRLFCKCKVRQDDIILLRDTDGKGIGEAVVQFESQKLAALAETLHGLDFLGTQVILTRINVKQMEDILARHV